MVEGQGALGEVVDEEADRVPGPALLQDAAGVEADVAAEGGERGGDPRPGVLSKRQAEFRMLPLRPGEIGCPDPEGVVGVDHRRVRAAGDGERELGGAGAEPGAELHDRHPLRGLGGKAAQQRGVEDAAHAREPRRMLLQVDHHRHLPRSMAAAV